MDLAGFRLRRGWRHLLGPWIGAIVVLAIAGGAATAAVGAARRTQRAYRNLLDSHHAADVIVSVEAPGTEAAELLDQIDALPSVTGHYRRAGVDLFVVANGEVDSRTRTGSGLGSLDAGRSPGRPLSLPLLRSGRAVDPRRADEVVVSAPLADAMHWRVGDDIQGLRLFTAAHDDYDENGGPRPERGVPVSAHIVGIGDVPEDYLDPPGKRERHLLLGPAFAQKYPGSEFYTVDFLKLRGGTAATAEFRRELDGLNAPADTSLPLTEIADARSRAERANGPIVDGLWLFALLAALVGVVLAVQTIGRVLRAHLADHSQLRALGASRAQRAGFELVGVVVAVGLAGALALSIGWLASPLAPVGAARSAGESPGLLFDAVALLGGFAAVVAVGLLAAIPGLLRVARATNLPGPVPIEPVERRSVIADAVARSGLGAPAMVGTGLALQPGRGASATPVRSALVSIVLVIAAVSGTLAFGVNFDRLATSPHRYGWNWDVAAGTAYGTIPTDAAQQVLQALPDARNVAGVTLGGMTIKDHTIAGIGIDPIRGDVAPIVVSGRTPATPDEIAMGAKTMRAIGAHIGDIVTGTVTNTDDARPQQLRVVGVVTMPNFAAGKFFETGLGTGVLGRASLFPVAGLASPDRGTYSYLLLRYAPTVTSKQLARTREVLASAGCVDPSCVFTDARPLEIEGFRNATGLPLAIGLVLALLLLATLTHVLLTTARRRQTDLAVLRALGCSPRQLAAVLRWQTVVLVGLGIVIGVPLGLAIGVAAWRAFTHQLGVPQGAVVPVLILTGFAALTIAVSLLLASGAGRRVRRATRAYRFDE